VKDAAVSEEIVQEIFLALWQKQQVDEIKSLRSFLYIAVKNKALNYLRDHQTRKSHEGEFARIQSENIYIDNEYEHLLLEDSIREAISELPEKCRQIFELSRNEELSYQQIADQLNISPKTVENQISIAIKKLKTKLSPFMNFFATFF
jgi:RNA polymerase sigma-70 factor (ECF subfamily)